MAFKICGGTLTSYVVLGLVCVPFLSCDSMQEEGIEVIQYTGPAITAEIAAVEALPWSVTVDGDIVTLTMKEIGDEPEIRHQLVLLNVPGKSLPVAPGYTLRPNTHEEHRLIAGTVAIQDWDPDGVMSGSVEGVILKKRTPLSRARLDFVFWVDNGEK